MAKAKKEKKPSYVYTISDIEAKYKIFMNPDLEKRTALKERVMLNGGYCPSRNEKTSDNRCMCKQFQNRDSEGWCKCRLYFKEARTKKQAAAFQNSTFEANEKKEKELEKQLAKEEKLKQKELEALNE